MRTLLLAASLMALTLAGCTSPDESLEDDSFELTATAVAGAIEVGESFTFALSMEGSPEATSSHIGAHYWRSNVADPTASFDDQAGACQHLAEPTGVPDEVTITCTMGTAGTYYVFGHLRVTEDDVDYNYWSTGHMVHVVDFELDASDVFTFATIGETESFNLTVTGEPTVGSDHIGAHYWDYITTDPTGEFDDRAGNCAHQEGTQDVPGTFQVDCTFDTAGTYYVYGHLRIAHAGDQVNFWALPFTVTVS